MIHPNSRNSLANLTLFQMNPWEHATRTPSEQPLEVASTPAASDNDPVNARILSFVVDLGNTVLTKKAASDLHA